MDFNFYVLGRSLSFPTKWDTLSFSDFETYWSPLSSLLSHLSYGSLFFCWANHLAVLEVKHLLFSQLAITQLYAITDLISYFADPGPVALHLLQYNSHLLPIWTKSYTKVSAVFARDIEVNTPKLAAVSSPHQPADRRRAGQSRAVAALRGPWRRRTGWEGR